MPSEIVVANMGRPTQYTQEIAERICEEIAITDQGLVHICEENEDFPTARTVYRWLLKHEDFRHMYAHAREQQTQVLADQLVEIANTPLVGASVKQSQKDGTTITRADMLEHRRLQIDTRKWILAKLNPRKYGDKQQHEVSGKDGGPIKVEAHDLSKLGTHELEQLEQLLNTATIPATSSR